MARSLEMGRTSGGLGETSFSIVTSLRHAACWACFADTNSKDRRKTNAIRYGGVVSLAALAALACATVLGAAQVENRAALDRRTIRDGVYTIQQATRGESATLVNCLKCHTLNEWSNPRFVENDWVDRRVGDLYTFIQRSMPEDDPGGLAPEEYRDIVAYMLWLSDAPPGETELSTDIEELDRIFIQPADVQ